MSKNVHVVPEWVVKSAGSSRAYSRHQKQSAAIKKATRLAKKRKSELLIHDHEGKIRERNTYTGKDPFPPRG